MRAAGGVLSLCSIHHHPYGPDTSVVLEAFCDLEEVKLARCDWRNHRPPLTDQQLLLLATLLSPDQDFCRFDKAAIAGVRVLVSIMALPDPIPQSVNVDVADRRIWSAGHQPARKVG